jgi:hypothetical protein
MANTTAQYGYNETLCIACENAAGSKITHDNFKIQQLINCGYALTNQVQASPLANQTFRYKDTAVDYRSDTIVLANTSEAFFTNYYWWECGAINKCSILE